MSPWLWISPLITAGIGWLFHRQALQFLLSARGPLLKNRAAWTAVIAKKAASMVSFAELEEKMTGSGSMQKIMPVIEEHIDEFLRHRLKEAMPMIAMFIGEKTIQQLKGIFMKELEDIFPRVMKNYAANLQQELDIEKLVTTRVNTIPDAALVVTLKSSLANELRIIPQFGAACGFIIGLIQIFIFLAAR